MTSAIAPRMGTPNGTTRLQASTALCPQLARADIRPKGWNSGYDPNRTLAGSKCRTAARLCCSPICYALTLGLGAADAIYSIEATRVHHASRRRGSDVAACGAGAAVGDAGDRGVVRSVGSEVDWPDGWVPPWSWRNRLCRRP